MAQAKEDRNGRYTVEVPLDASQIENFKPEQEVKVAIHAADKVLGSAIARLSAEGKGKATVALKEVAPGMRAAVGPGTATDEELIGLQTIRVDVPGRLLREKGKLALNEVVIHSYYWFWWLRWCRNFTIRGVVLCPNGEPVPGAKVCAYDVDWWWWWSSKQLAGCATTDLNGAFEINFRWCCGWWPWWWWRARQWALEPALVERISSTLLGSPSLASPGEPTPQPDISVFQRLIGDEAQMGVPVGKPLDPAILPPLRDQLTTVLPRAPELERLRIWPWSPWSPWWDCTPDVIFKVTQDCDDQATLIVDENFFDARWNIPQESSVTLVANENACCLELPEGCLEGNCLAVTMACDDTVDTIGGNIDAPPSPEGYKNPGLVSVFGDRPYAGSVPISGTADCMDGVHFYEFEWTTTPGVPASWAAMPPDAAGSFVRKYLRFSDLTINPVTFSTTFIDGHHVFETLQHYEANNPPVDWGANRIWIQNRNRLMNWQTLNNFADGLYYLRVKGYDLVAGNLTNERVLHICSHEDLDNFVVLRIDNRSEGSGPIDSNGHPCGSGTVHKCTSEPDVEFVSVKIVHADSTETDVAACGNFPVTSTDKLQIDFVAHDPDGHLAKYTLRTTWGESEVKNLLTLGGTLEPSPIAVAWAPAAAQVGPDYANALTAPVPAISPMWHGGVIRLTIDDATQVFEETCCYQLELRAHKRTIVNCDDSLWGHWNYAEYSFMISTS